MKAAFPMVKAAFGVMSRNDGPITYVDVITAFLLVEVCNWPESKARQSGRQHAKVTTRSSEPGYQRTDAGT